MKFINFYILLARNGFFYFNQIYMKTISKKFDINPDKNGFFGAYGGQIIPPQLKPIFDEIADFYLQIKDTPKFKAEMS